MEINEATKTYILAHTHDDVRQLALRGCKDADVDFKFALQQIEGRQKAKEKLPDFFENESVCYPPTVSMEQCSSTLTAQYKASLVEGESFADLSGGFGIDTFALSRKFQYGHHIEPNTELSEMVQHNARVLNINNLEFHQSTMEAVLSQLPYVDCLYLDPSRRDVQGNRVVRLEECTPNVLEWKTALLEKCKTLMVKLSPMIDIKRTLLQLPEVSAVHTVAVNGECKEVILMLSSVQSATDRTFKAVNLRKEGEQSFVTTQREEEESVPMLTQAPGHYLYEPNAAILKAGAFKSVAVQYHVEKLHPHTHLYSSDTLVSDFPGRAFEIEQVIPFNKKRIKQAIGDIAKANVAVRNFPITAESLRALLKVKDGGDIYLFGATLADGQYVLLKTKKAGN